MSAPATWDDATWRAENLRLLQKWCGGRVKFWAYMPSHSRLTLRVESSDVGGNLHLVCGGCLRVRGPFEWAGCSLEITDDRDEEGEPVEILRDSRAGFELRCRVMSAVENVGPVYFLDRLAPLDPTWRTARVLALAEAIQHGHCFGRLPELAGALEEAGCADAAILSHCRYSSEHKAECWVVDLILEKA